MKRQSKLLISFLTAVVFVFASASVSNAAIKTSARNAVLVDRVSGNVMFSKGAYEKTYPASTTKMMTAIVYYEKFKDKLSGSVSVTEAMMKRVPIGSSNMKLKAGEVVTREQLFNGLMLVSGNDAAIVMAYDYGGMEAFVEEMNNKAKQFGMDSTHFANPHGFHDDNQYTTAYDFSILAREYLKYEYLRELAAKGKYEMSATNIRDAEVIYNTNRLVSDNEKTKDYLYDKATGLKTGFTNQAKNCFVASAEDNGTGLIWVGFGYESTDERFSEAKEIFEYAFNNFSKVNVYSNIKDARLYIGAEDLNIAQYEYGNIDAVVQVNADEQVMIDNDAINSLETGEVSAKFTPKTGITYPIKEGDYIGTIEYNSNDYLIYTARAFSAKYVEDRKVPELFKTIVRNKKGEVKADSFFERTALTGIRKKNGVKTAGSKSTEKKAS